MANLRVVSLAASLATVATPAMGDWPCPSQKLLPTSPSPNAHFGYPVAVDGEWALVGAMHDAADHGAVHVYRRDQGAWVFTGKLLAPDGLTGDGFSSRLSLQGTLAVVGAAGQADGSGASYVYRHKGTAWQFNAKLSPPDLDPDDNFGAGVAVIDGTIFVAAPHNDDIAAEAGCVYVFEQVGELWIQAAKVYAPDAHAGLRFGDEAIAASKDLLIVGAMLDDSAGPASGAAYVFRREASGWVFEQKLVASDATPFAEFGRSADIADEIAVVGSPRTDEFGQDSGSAYVFRHIGRDWVEDGKLLASIGGSENDLLGTAVACTDSMVLVGAPTDEPGGLLASGSVHRFNRLPSGWSPGERLPSPEPWPTALFGVAISLDGESAIIGAFEDDESGPNMGSAFMTSVADSDGDGVQDCIDGCPGDPLKTSPGQCGCGVPELDSDGDGHCDAVDNCPSIANPDQADCDSDGVGDACALATGSPDADGDGIPDECQYLLVPEEFPTIAAAIAAAVDGESVSIAPGTYVEHLWLAGKDLHLLGRAPGVVVDGQGQPGTMLAIGPGVTASTLVRGIAFRGSGDGSPLPQVPQFVVGGAVLVNQASPRFEQCVFGDNHCSMFGGAVYTLMSSASFTDCLFEGNSAGLDGGGLQAITSAIDLVGCTFADNHSSGYGGAAHLALGAPFGDNLMQVTDCAFTGNSAQTGGGVRFHTTGPDRRLVVTGSEFAGNTAPQGGAIWAAPSVPGALELGTTTLCDNSTPQIMALSYVDLGGNDICPCTGDINADGVVNAADLSILLGYWGRLSPSAPPGIDMDGDAAVDAADLSILLGSWGPCP